MKIKIKRIDKNFPLPEYKTAGAAAFDFYSRSDVVIEPKSIGYIPLNVVIMIPAGYVLNVFARSGTHKKGLMMANGVGVIDPDFCGDDDEIKAVYYNFTDSSVKVSAGERIAQGIFKKIDPAEWEEIDKMSNLSRGGFGTTGAI